MPADKSRGVIIRNTKLSDLDAINDVYTRVYRDEKSPWTEKQIASHLKVFPEGQFVAVDSKTDQVVGMAASLIVSWDDYNIDDNWHDFTDHGMFTNHDPRGRTLYGADVMVDPQQQGRGIGKKIYKARRELTRSLGLRRIRACARLRGYGRYRHEMSPEEYVIKVIRKELGDPTLSFQLKQGFRVLGVVRDYLHDDPESQGHGALIEWVNYQVAQRRDTYGRPRKFGRPRRKQGQAPPPTN